MAERYVSPFAADNIDELEADGISSEVTLGALGLEVGEPFGYWFDFGDSWWHQINMESLKTASKYDKLVVVKFSTTAPACPRNVPQLAPHQ